MTVALFLSSFGSGLGDGLFSPCFFVSTAHFFQKASENTKRHLNLIILGEVCGSAGRGRRLSLSVDGDFGDPPSYSTVSVLRVAIERISFSPRRQS